LSGGLVSFEISILPVFMTDGYCSTFWWVGGVIVGKNRGGGFRERKGEKKASFWGAWGWRWLKYLFKEGLEDFGVFEGGGVGGFYIG
jgi:hypothetical protein